MRLEDRPVLGDAPGGGKIAGPLPEEIRIIDEMLREARRSLTWVEIDHRTIPSLKAFRRVTRDVEVLVSGGWFPMDDRFWLHVSAAGPTAPPSWMRLREVKDLFIGHDRVAVQLLPRTVDHVNIHPHALHLWCCLTEDAVPNFGAGGTI